MSKDRVTFIGIDIGTQGARVAMADASGELLAAREEAFPLTAASREEQSPAAWWEACLSCLRGVLAEAGSQAVSALRAIAVSSTSGTVIPLDAENRPLHNALMYSDKRSEAEARQCRELAEALNPAGFTAFNSSSGLSKMVWFVNNFPDEAARLSRWAHAADYITGRLSGRWGLSDYTNALKSGFDVRKMEWPPYIWERLPLKRSWLPEVLPSGSPVGNIDPALARDLGLKEDVRVSSGITDGCASQIASGAVSLGTWNSTIGTTLVIKGVTREELRDPEGRFYSHRHPDGYWMPGGASNTGADWIKEFGSGAALHALSEEAGKLLPGGHIAYPLRQEGERFPFIAPQARGFEPEGLAPLQRLLAGMEGLAYLERYAFELVEELSGEKPDALYAAGGASRNDTWLRIRSNVLKLPVHRMEQESGAFGAAVLAASRTWFRSLEEAARSMIRSGKEIRPEPELMQDYEKHYTNFIRTLKEKGYIQPAKKHA